MAGCGCGNQTCACVLAAGDGIQITGAGTPSAPFKIAATLTNLGQFLTVHDTPSVNLTLTGTGTGLDPLVLSGVSTVKMTDLVDVVDPSGPAIGESPVWQGDHFDFSLPPATPAGSVNVSDGLLGTGAAITPLKVAVSGVWGSGNLAGLGSDSTIGLEVYKDSAGQVRARPVSNPDWSAIQNKPTTFPPSAHTHTASQITDLATNGNVAFVGGKRITTDSAHSTPPTSPSPAAGDVFVYPRGAGA